ncbi:Gfo/Idh/MocA family oxidoreductase [bacterium]|nr:Gfo/Idh/MocA family oxidoreductase [bacterium]
MAQKLKIGIIGAGGIARGPHINGWKQVADAEVVAVCDISKGAAESMAREHGIPNVFTDFRELVKLTEIDAVDICTPNRVHTPAVLAAFARRKHVLCEKPLAVTVREVKQMQAAAARARKLLMTAQHQRFSGISTAVKQFIATHPIGEVYHARVHAVRRNLLPTNPGFIDPALSGGGPCMDIGVHALDLAMWLMDSPMPVRVSGRMMTNFAMGHDIPGAWGDWDRKLFGVEDFASGFVHFENGATMVLEASWLQHQQEKEDMSCRLFGRKGGVSWPAGHYSSAANGALFDAAIQAHHVQSAHAEEIKAFAHAVRTGGPSPVPVDQTIKVIAILEGIMRSSERGGREVALNLRNGK